MGKRVLSWFSCGAASAVCAKLAIMEYGTDCIPVYCNTSANEHPDNKRFFCQVQDWLGTEIKILSSPHVTTVEQVFEARKYMSGLRGAPCTVELKKIPRFNFQLPTDIHAFGYTVEEENRRQKFVANNPELSLIWPLKDWLFTKKMCLQRLESAKIKIPVMYTLGYKNNNCLGCVKASSPKYWNKIRANFPDTFARRSEQSRAIGCQLTRTKINGKWERIFLDELDLEDMHDFKEDLSCGPECTTTQMEG